MLIETQPATSKMASIEGVKMPPASLCLMAIKRIHQTSLSGANNMTNGNDGRSCAE